jgi:hypothetical protein
VSAEVAVDVLADLGRGLLADLEAALDTCVLFMIDKVWRPTRRGQSFIGAVLKRHAERPRPICGPDSPGISIFAAQRHIRGRPQNPMLSALRSQRLPTVNPFQPAAGRVRDLRGVVAGHE